MKTTSALGAAFWIAGLILAKGFWWTALAAVFPLYGVYLVVVKAMTMGGWL